MCPTFSDCARPVPKKLFVEQINFGDLPPTTPPPSPKKFRSVYHFKGPNAYDYHSDGIWNSTAHVLKTTCNFRGRLYKKVIKVFYN